MLIAKRFRENLWQKPARKQGWKNRVKKTPLLTRGFLPRIFLQSGNQMLMQNLQQKIVLSHGLGVNL